MSQHRYIPYGYKVIGVNTEIDEAESKIVKSIFRDYINGLSINEISKNLLIRNASYYNNKSNWNKNTVSRILKNQVYTGTDKYPSIISGETYEKVQQIMGVRRNNAESNKFATSLTYKVFCSDCGERYKREKMPNGKTIWYCRKEQLTTTIEESQLFGVIKKLFNELKVHPEEISKDLSETLKYQPTTEIIKFNNEINQNLETGNIDIKDIQASILKFAALKYQNCRIDMTPIISKTLQDELTDEKTTDDDYARVISQTVATIMISSQGEVQIKFKNGAIAYDKIERR